MKKYLSKVASVVASLSLVASALPVNAATTVYDYVNVTGQVNQALAFAITQSNNAAVETSQCALGVIAYGSVATCSYGLRISTNGTTGFHAEFNATGTFSNGTYSFIDVSDGAVSANSEEYGLAIAPSTDGGFVPGPAWTGATIVTSTYSGADRAVVTSTSTNATVSYTAPFDANKGTTTPAASTLTVVTHKASISLGTPQGNYHQKVWWQVTATP